MSHKYINTFCSEYCHVEMQLIAKKHVVIYFVCNFKLKNQSLTWKQMTDLAKFFLEFILLIGLPLCVLLQKMFYKCSIWKTSLFGYIEIRENKRGWIIWEGKIAQYYQYSYITNIHIINILPCDFYLYTNWEANVRDCEHEKG